MVSISNEKEKLTIDLYKAMLMYRIAFQLFNWRNISFHIKNNLLI